jgi:DNA-binding MarR family transcriptional regulator
MPSKKGEREIQVLETIAKNDRVSRYDISKLSGLHRQQVKREVAKLRKRKLIDGIWMRRRKWKKAKTFCRLTPTGFAWLLRKKPETYKDVHLNYRKAFTPLLSKRWSYLENQGLGEYARDLLAEAADHYLSGRDEAQVLEAHQSVGLLSILDDYFLLYANPLGGIMLAIASDPELSQGYRRALETVAEHQKNWVQQRLDALKAKGRPVQKIEPQAQEPELTKEAKQHTNRRIQRWRREGYLIKTPARSSA